MASGKKLTYWLDTSYLDPQITPKHKKLRNLRKNTATDHVHSFSMWMEGLANIPKLVLTIGHLTTKKSSPKKIQNPLMPWNNSGMLDLWLGTCLGWCKMQMQMVGGGCGLSLPLWKIYEFVSWYCYVLLYYFMLFPNEWENQIHVPVTANQNITVKYPLNNQPAFEIPSGCFT